MNTVPDFMFSDPERPHLGGYLKGGDPSSWYPEMWEWMVISSEIRSVIDVGCGEGHSIRWFHEHGLIAHGVEGVPQNNPLILAHDYTTGPYIPKRRFDLCWSCEFVEHVEERYVPNFLATFASAEYVLMTHALPGQGGHHHVNCQEPDYWIEKLNGVGFSFSESLTASTRMLCPHGYYAHTGLAFMRTQAGTTIPSP